MILEVLPMPSYFVGAVRIPWENDWKIKTLNFPWTQILDYFILKPDPDSVFDPLMEVQVPKFLNWIHFNS